MFSSKQTMWSDGYFNPHAWDKYGFDEYQLKHCCFGSDGDEQGEATGGDLGGADDFYEDDTPVTPDDYSGLQEATGMSPEEVMDAMGVAQATSVATNPYTDMIAHGIIADPRAATSATGWINPDTGKYMGNPGLMPSEMGFVPQYGYDVYGEDRYGGNQQIVGTRNIRMDKRADPLNPIPNDLTLTPYDPSKISREDLGKSYTDAYRGSTDLGSGIASLFGIKSPVEFDPEKGFYEGTTFDPFDAPLISGALSLLSPPLGALYGLTKGIVKGDPIGGALSMIGPFSPLRPAVDAAGNILGAANVWTGGNTTFSDLVGLGTPVSNKYGTGPAPYSFMGEIIDPTISIDRTSMAPISNPFDTLVDFKDDVLDYGRGIFSPSNYEPGIYSGPLDPQLTADKFHSFSPLGISPHADPFNTSIQTRGNLGPTSNPQLSPQHLEGLKLGAQQAVKDAMLDIGREERANAILGIDPLPMAPIPIRKGGVREAQQVVKDALYNY